MGENTPSLVPVVGPSIRGDLRVAVGPHRYTIHDGFRPVTDAELAEMGYAYMAENTTPGPDVTVAVTMPPELAFWVPEVEEALAGMYRLPSLHEYAVLLDLAQLVAKELRQQ